MPQKLHPEPRSDRPPPIQPDIVDGQQQVAAQLSRLLDNVFEVPGLGWRFGLDPILGLIPGLGDLASMLASIYILGIASKSGVPRITLLRMGLNVGIDALVGSLPIVGDMFDLWWKANQKNVDLLRRETATPNSPTRQARRGDWLFVGAILLVLAGLLCLSAFVSFQILSFLFERLGPPPPSAGS